MLVTGQIFLDSFDGYNNLTSSLNFTIGPLGNVSGITVLGLSSVLENGLDVSKLTYSKEMS